MNRTFAIALIACLILAGCALFSNERMANTHTNKTVKVRYEYVIEYYPEDVDTSYVAENVLVLVMKDNTTYYLPVKPTPKPDIISPGEETQYTKKD
jgi:hypothetical protein